MKNRKHKTMPLQLELRPRVRIEWNTGTRTILSKKDRSRMRRYLKAELRKKMKDFFQ